MELSTFLNAFTGLMVIIDPIGAAIFFHAILPTEALQHRRVMAVKAVAISCILMVAFGLYGEPLLHKLGIDINALRIAGGLLLFYSAFGMITGHEEVSETTLDDVSVYPMSIPILAGPGALTLCILLFSNANNFTQQISVTLAIISVLLITLLLLLYAHYIQKVIGKTGDEILRRFLGVILAALAIQFIYDGVTNIGSVT
ncbi:MarC family protein [Thiolinea disciformis]|uniref:MarC family protein n=1 Tax=Thiolinea disciformis TaxID=125614 RepID=UPI00036DE6AE|nr:MarC family protein [Thiolinea disciformis]